MLKNLFFPSLMLCVVFFIACNKENSTTPELSGRKVISDDACSGTATVKGRVELLLKDNMMGDQYEIHVAKLTKTAIYDSISRKLIDIRFVVLNEAKDRKKIVIQEAPSDFSANLEAGYYLMYAYPSLPDRKKARYYSFGDTLLLCGGQVKDFGTVKF